MLPIRPFVLAFIALGVGCQADGALPCEHANECVRADKQGGRCVRASDEGQSFCAFQSVQNCSATETKLEWDETAPDYLAGTCVLQVGPGDGGEDGPCGRDPQHGDLGEKCGRCLMGEYVCQNNVVTCLDESEEEVLTPGQIENLGQARCSSYGSSADGTDCRANFAFDNNPATGWFSQVPALDRDPTLGWRADDESTCFTQVTVTNTRLLKDPAMRGAGFIKVVVRVFDLEGNRKLSRQAQYPVGEDSLTVQLTDGGRPGVLGRELSIEFVGYKSTKGGGVSDIFISRAIPGE